MEISTGYKLIEETFYEHEKCGLKEIDYLNLIDPWFVIQKHSPYKELLKVKYAEEEITNYFHNGRYLNQWSSFSGRVTNEVASCSTMQSVLY